MNAVFMDPNRAQRMAELLKAMAHPVRLQVLCLLRGGEANVSQILERLGLVQSMVSNQLAILRVHDLVKVRRAGGFAWYRINAERVAEVLGCLTDHASEPMTPTEDEEAP
ncbi:MAG TPA: metalloregulator ArsR/SmtB family transcription factor [Myxococcota bacterium]|nr:metalloregulator ArsR/SmtB family transcription factor [Myxococcota bacterium]